MRIDTSDAIAVLYDQRARFAADWEASRSRGVTDADARDYCWARLCARYERDLHAKAVERATETPSHAGMPAA